VVGVLGVVEETAERLLAVVVAACRHAGIIHAQTQCAVAGEEVG